MPKPGFDFLFVVDKKESPLWRAASSRCESSNAAIVAATDFVSAYSLAKYIESVKPSVVIVSWRTAFEQLVSRKRSKRLLLQLDLSMYLLIPDFVGIHNPTELEQSLIYSADGFIVTSNLLREAYLENYQTESIDVLHDLPNLQQISLIQQAKMKTESNKVIWVGNSKWGERLGFEDHKGLKKLAVPVFKILSGLDKEIEVKIIDSAYAWISNLKVLEEIHGAACLLVTSDSEGTGLPILEAAAIGTPVVSVNVGIAPEILTGELENQIVYRNPELIAERIFQTIRNRESLSQLIRSNWEEYKFNAQTELGVLLLKRSSQGNWRNSKPKDSTVAFIVWLVRRARSWTIATIGLRN
jgi:glycosyltransferase involved in cell wall biosynthesis